MDKNGKFYFKMVMRIFVQKIVLNSLEEVIRESALLVKGPHVAVSGGSTYAKLFAGWTKNFENQGSVRLQEIKKINFFPVDERQVGFEEPGNNWKVAFDQLLAPVGIPEQKSNMAVTAKQFETLLHKKMGEQPVFNQIFLGMGDDGHTASLFPGTAPLLDRKSLVLETISPKTPFPRVTLGFRPIWECEELIVIALGADKTPMVKRMLQGDMSLPITMALAGHTRATLILDKAAAGE